MMKKSNRNKYLGFLMTKLMIIKIILCANVYANQIVITSSETLEVCGPRTLEVKELEIKEKITPPKFHKKPKPIIKPKVIEKPQMCSGCDANTFIYLEPQQFSLKCFKHLLRGEAFATDPLPPCFKIYANETGVAALHPTPGLEERVIPNVNIFLRNPGCYIACYSKNPDKSVFPVTSNIYLVGQIRVRGSYVGRMCVPENYETVDIRGERAFKELCSKSFSCIGNSCWAGGDTGKWFGLQ